MGVDGPARFGPCLEASAAYLHYALHLPTARLRALLRELHGVALSTGEGLWLHVICDGTVTCHCLGARGDVWTEYSGTATPNCFLSCPSQCRRLATASTTPTCCATREIVELEKDPDGRAAHIQRLLLGARDVTAHWFDTTGGAVPEPVYQATTAVGTCSWHRSWTATRAGSH